MASSHLPGWLLLVVTGCASVAPPAADPAPVAREALPAGPRLRSADLRADAALLRRVYEALHPGLHHHLEQPALDARWAALDQALARDQTLQEAFIAFSRFTAALRCSHSKPNLFNQPAQVRAALLSHPRLPIRFRWLGDRMIATASAAGLAPGDEVLAIDGVPASAILAALLPLVAADGGNDAARRRALDARGDERYGAFDVLYPMLFPLSPTHARLRVRSARGAVRELMVATVGERALADVAPGPSWTLRQEGSTAILTMPTWALYDRDPAWPDRLEATWRAIVDAGTTDLVIDLRGNEGGLAEIGDALLAHIIERPVSLGPVRRLVRFREVPADLAAHLETWDRTFFTLGRDARPVADGFYELAADRGAALAPVAPRFAGRVWLLVDAANSSATFRFAGVAQRLGLATLVGEPTGGSQRGGNGGAFFFLQLPGSGIEIDVPLIATTTPSSPDAGLTPDIVVAPTPADLAAGRDVALGAVKAAIARRAR